MQIQWLGLRGLHAEVRATVEARLRRLAQGHDDLAQLRIGAGGLVRESGVRRVSITAQLHGSPLCVVREGEALGLALSDALDALEREVRARRRRLCEQHPHEPPLGALTRSAP